MLNSNIVEALRVLNREVNRIQKSTDRYKVMHEIKQELEAIKKGEWLLEPEYRTREPSAVEKAIAKFISGRYSEVTEEDVLMNLHLSQTKVAEKFKFDSLDWLEMIMELEDEFDVEVDLHYEKNETKLYELVEHIQKML
jgi:acyl carrier protein